MSKKRKKLRGTVQKVIKHPSQAEKAQIDVHDADDLYREIRVENVLTDDEGREGRLKAGEKVNVQEKKIKPLIAERLPLCQARRAHELLGKGGVIGKIVLTPNG